MYQRLIIKILSVSVLSLFAIPGMGATPIPFTVNYDASYRGISAQATISLAQQDDGIFLAHSEIKVKFLGVTATSINERSWFEWVEDAPRPQHYEYIQSGIGGRERSIDFDWQQNLASTNVDGNLNEVILSGETLDELSMYNHIRNAISKGEQEIYFDVIDRDHVEQYHYRVLGEEEVATDVGTFDTVKVEKIRENSERVTQLWFAPEQNMLLIKLFQRDPDGDEYEITLENAELNGSPLTGR